MGLVSWLRRTGYVGDVESNNERDRSYGCCQAVAKWAGWQSLEMDVSVVEDQSGIELLFDIV